MGKLIAITSQKGGCGKSTFSTFLANALNERGVKVKLYDCDAQRSISTTRRMDIAEVEDPSKLYPIEVSTAIKLGGLLDKSEDSYEYTIVDLPGNVTEKGIMGVIAMSDYLIIPHDCNTVGVTSNLEFMRILTRELFPILEKQNADVPNVLHIHSRFTESLKLHKEFENDKHEIFPVGTWFKTPFRKLDASYADIQTIRKYTHPKYGYEMDMLVDEFINLTK